MVKPLWAVAGVALLGTAGVAGAIVVASPGGEEEAVQQVETTTAAATASAAPSATEVAVETAAPSPAPGRTPGAGEMLYRWVNLTVLIPDGSGVTAGPGGHLYPGIPARFVIVKVDPEDSRIISSVVLDSENGAIVEEQVLDQHRADIDRVLATLSVSLFDRTTAPWPNNGEPSPELARHTEGGLTYIEPSPASGFYMGFGVADPGGSYVRISNERSTAFIQFRPEGPRYDTSIVHEEDKAIFDRWFASIKQCGTDIQC